MLKNKKTIYLCFSFEDTFESIESTEEMFVTRILLTSLLLFALLFVGTDSTFSRTGFVNNFMNDWNCRLNLMTTIDGFDSIIESYYVNNSNKYLFKSFVFIQNFVSIEQKRRDLQNLLSGPQSCCDGPDGTGILHY